MRIAQIAPLTESVPPPGYGGTERVVSYLTEGLVRHGVDVTLFASGGSKTAAKLRSTCRVALRAYLSSVRAVPRQTLLLELLLKHAHQVDIIHFHTELLHFPLARRMARPCLTTLYGRLDWSDITDLYRQFSNLNFRSVSNARRMPMPHLNWLDSDLPETYPSLGREGYLTVRYDRQLSGAVIPSRRLRFCGVPETERPKPG